MLTPWIYIYVYAYVYAHVCMSEHVGDMSKSAYVVQTTVIPTQRTDMNCLDSAATTCLT